MKYVYELIEKNNFFIAKEFQKFTRKFLIEKTQELCSSEIVRIPEFNLYNYIEEYFMENNVNACFIEEIKKSSSPSIIGVHLGIVNYDYAQNATYKLNFYNTNFIKLQN